MKKNLLSGASVILFMFLAMASGVNKIHYNAFNYKNLVENETDNRDYVVKNDGTKIYGNQVNTSKGFFSKTQIQIDNQKFKTSEIKAFYHDGFFYNNIENEFAQRIVHGKINVYVQFTRVQFDNGRNSYISTYHYAQRGENGKFTAFGDQESMKKLVSDCPLSVNMINLSNSQLTKAIKKDPNYLNKVFEIYNNNCQKVEP